MKKTKLIKSQRELAGMLGRDEAQVSRYLKDPRWTFGSAPWRASDVPEMLRWIAGELRTESERAPKGELAGLRKQKLETEIRKLLASAETVELQLSRERGKVVDADAVKSEWASIGQLIRAGLQNLPSQLAATALRLGLPNPMISEFQLDAQTIVDDALRALATGGKK